MGEKSASVLMEAKSREKRTSADRGHRGRLWWGDITRLWVKTGFRPPSMSPTKNFPGANWSFPSAKKWPRGSWDPVCCLTSKLEPFFWGGVIYLVPDPSSSQQCDLQSAGRSQIRLGAVGSLPWGFRSVSYQPTADVSKQSPLTPADDKSFTPLLRYSCVW